MYAIDTLIEYREFLYDYSRIYMRYKAHPDELYMVSVGKHWEIRFPYFDPSLDSYVHSKLKSFRSKQKAERFLTGYQHYYWMQDEYE